MACEFRVVTILTMKSSQVACHRNEQRIRQFCHWLQALVLDIGFAAQAQI